jgi:hypothetical protein
MRNWIALVTLTLATTFTGCGDGGFSAENPMQVLTDVSVSGEVNPDAEPDEAVFDAGVPDADAEADAGPDAEADAGPDAEASDSGPPDVGVPDSGPITEPDPLPAPVGDGDACTWDVCDNEGCIQVPRSSFHGLPDNRGILYGGVVLPGGDFVFAGNNGNQARHTRMGHSGAWDPWPLGAGIGRNILVQGNTLVGFVGRVILEGGIRGLRLVTQDPEDGDLLVDTTITGADMLGFTPHPDGGYAALIYIRGSGFATVRYSSQGAVLWSYPLHSGLGRDLVPAPDGFYTSADVMGASEVIRYGFDGQELWVASIPSKVGISIQMLAATAEGGVLLSTVAPDGVPQVTYLSPEGHEHWTTRLEMEAEEFRTDPVGVIASADGIYVVGNRRSIATNQENVFVGRLSEEGNLEDLWLWEGAEGTARLYGVMALPEGGVVAYGEMGFTPYWQVLDARGRCPFL